MRTSGAFSQSILTGLNKALIALIASAALFISRFKNNTKLEEATPSESEVSGATEWRFGYPPECHGTSRSVTMIG